MGMAAWESGKIYYSVHKMHLLCLTTMLKTCA